MLKEHQDRQEIIIAVVIIEVEITVIEIENQEISILFLK